MGRVLGLSRRRRDLLVQNGRVSRLLGVELERALARSCRPTAGSEALPLTRDTVTA